MTGGCGCPYCGGSAPECLTCRGVRATGVAEPVTAPPTAPVPERASWKLTLADLQVLATTAERNGTTHAFQAVALQWCGKANAEIERQRGVIAQVSARCDHLGMSLGEIKAERDRLRAEVRQLEDAPCDDCRDAARYRWLRDSPHADWRPIALRQGGAYSADDLVDKAMRNDTPDPAA